MMKFGFVYLLGNKAMPCIYKIGCTERAPHQRAAELSAATGVPHEFSVLLYMEVAYFQEVERRIHRELADFRVSNEREFFCFGPAHMEWLRWVFKSYPDALSFVECAWRRFYPHDCSEYVETWIDEGCNLVLPDAAPISLGNLQLIAG
jgi:hypothetical protein